MTHFKFNFVILFCILFFPHESLSVSESYYQILSDVEEGVDYYKTLGVIRGASHSEIRKAFSHLSLKFHPDKNHEEGATERYQKIVFAYEILSDDDKRKEYHSLLDEGIPWHQKYYGKYAHRYGAPDHDIRYVLASLIAFITIAKFLYRHYRRYILLGLVRRTDRYQRALRKKQDSEGVTDKEKKKRKSQLQEEPELEWYISLSGMKQLWSTLFETEDDRASTPGAVLTEDGLEVQIVGAEKPKFTDLFVIQLIMLPYTIGFWIYQNFGALFLGKTKSQKEIDEEIRSRLNMTKSEFQEYKEKMEEREEKLRTSAKYKRVRRIMKHRTPVSLGPE